MLQSALGVLFQSVVCIIKWICFAGDKTGNEEEKSSRDVVKRKAVPSPPPHTEIYRLAGCDSARAMKDVKRR